MIDVSSYQGRIDWLKVHAGGVRYAYVKLLETAEDPDARHNLEHARNAGIVTGVYFYAHPAEPPTRAARRFLALADQVHALEPGSLRPALDLEVQEGHDWAFLNDWKSQWFAAVDERIGCRAVFYSYWYFWKQMRLYDDRPVWGAAIGNGFTPPLSWWIHQYSFTGRIDGIHGNVDLDRLRHTPPLIPA